MTSLRQLVLHTEVPLVDPRRLEAERGRIERQRRVRIVAARRGQILQPPEVESRVQHARRVGDHVEDHVALRPVVEDPEAAADDGLSFTRQVVDRADARRDAEGVAVLELIVDPLAGLEAAVEPIRAGREPADEALFNGIGHRRDRIAGDQRRVHPAAHAAGARRAADAHRRIELRGIGLKSNWSGRKFDACSVVSHCGVR